MEGRLSSHKRNQATVLTKGPSPHTFTRLFLPRAYFQAPTVSPFCVPAFAARGFSLSPSARLHERVSGRTLPVAAGPFAPTGPLAKRPCPRNGPQHRAPLAVRNAGRTRVRRDHPPAKEQRRHDIAAEACSGRFRVAAAGGPWRSWSDAAPPPLPSCRPRSAGPPCPKPSAVATGDALQRPLAEWLSQAHICSQTTIFHGRIPKQIHPKATKDAQHQEPVAHVEASTEAVGPYCARGPCRRA